jgi:probable F420-dependent oxidoreductase
MRIGVTIMPTERSIPLWDFARAAEELGFESVFVPEHTHIPAARQTPFPQGGELPDAYRRVFDPFVALAAAAMQTTTIRIGTGICLVTQHDPITLAKQVATLDHVSGGRFLFGVGAGWNREEMANHGTPPDQRWAVLRERVLAMTAIWTQDLAEYHGSHVSFDKIWSWPKPLQRPRPPLLLGGASRPALERVAELADAWMPIATDPATIAEQRRTLDDLAAAAGRDRVPVTVFSPPAQPGLLAEYARLGVERCVLGVPSADALEVLPRLRKYAARLGLSPG